MEQQGKVALVTGEGSVFGRGKAIGLARAGADVAINYYGNAAGAEETAEQVRAAGTRALTVKADVGAPDEVERMFAALDETFGRFDILVNNSGIGGGGRIH